MLAYFWSYYVIVYYLIFPLYEEEPEPDPVGKFKLKQKFILGQKSYIIEMSTIYEFYSILSMNNHRNINFIDFFLSVVPEQPECPCLLALL